MDMLPMAGEGHLQPLPPLTRRLWAESELRSLASVPSFVKCSLWSQSFASPVTASPGVDFPLSAASPLGPGGRVCRWGHLPRRGLRLDGPRCRVGTEVGAVRPVSPCPDTRPPAQELCSGKAVGSGVGSGCPVQDSEEEMRAETGPFLSPKPKAAWGPRSSPSGPPGSPSEHRDVAQPLLCRPLPDIPAARLPLINA